MAQLEPGRLPQRNGATGRDSGVPRAHSRWRDWSRGASSRLTFSVDETRQASAPATTFPVVTCALMLGESTPTAASIVRPNDASVLAGAISPLAAARPVLESIARPGEDRILASRLEFLGVPIAGAARNGSRLCR